MHSYLYIHTQHTYIPTDIHTYTHACIHACIYADRQTQTNSMCTYAHIHVHMYTRMHIHTYACTYIHTYARTCIHAHTHAHIHMPMYTRAHIHILHILLLCQYSLCIIIKWFPWLHNYFIHCIDHIIQINLNQ